jgi:hypothetical protein
MRWLRLAGYALVVLMVLAMAGIVAMVASGRSSVRGHAR